MFLSNARQSRRTAIWTTLWFLACSGFLFRAELVQSTSVPLSSTDVATVPLFNAWTIGWNADQLQHGFSDYWNAPIFHPSQAAFAYSEPQPATLLMAPIVWTTGSIITAYKCWLVLSVALNGVFAGLLLRRLGYRPLLQVCGGTAVMLLPIVWQRIDVSQLVPLWGILWFWSCLMQMNQGATWRRGVETGAAFASCFALCVHHALFLSLLAPFGALLLVRHLRHSAFLRATALALITAATIVLPIVIPISQAADSQNFARREKLIRSLSAHPTHYLASPAGSLTRVSRFDAKPSRQFCPGWVRMTLALLGMVTGLWRPGRRCWTAFVSVTGLVAFAFSQGPTLSLFGWQPWSELMEYVPGVDQVRSVYRFAYFVQLAVVLLAVEGLAAVTRGSEWLSRKCQSAWKGNVLLASLVLPSAVIVAAEVLPQAGGRGGIPEVAQHRTWTTFVRENAAPDRPIVCLPMSGGSAVANYDITTRWMCYGLEHRVPLLNGYSGFFPPSYIMLRQQVTQQFPSADVIREFVRRDVQMIVVARIYCGPQAMRRLSTPQTRVELILEDPIGIDVYRLVPRSQESTD
ncbi:MAG: hypothetical protein NXI04_00690 [Planctomycetaceae bacterium]|nr:hypothetical protein [Planctomycetaceae bacterium]